MVKRLLALILCLPLVLCACQPPPKIAPPSSEMGESVVDAFACEEDSSMIEEISSEETSSELPSEEPSSIAPSSQAASSKLKAVSSKAASSKAASSKPTPAPTNVIIPNKELKGAWLAFYELDYRGKTKNQFILDITDKFKRMRDFGLNAVFVHVRSHGDAFYESKYFPWTVYFADSKPGKQGSAPGYDPLALMVTIAHEVGLELHAWINPYRVVMTGTVANLDTLSDNNPAKKWLAEGTDDVLRCTNGTGLYYNPASKRARELALNGIKEILDKYAVDGIHFDDYFYPDYSPDFDKTAYERYKKDPANFFGVDFSKDRYKKCIDDGATYKTLTLQQFRRTCVSLLVADIYAAVKVKSSQLVFGISPAANINNNVNNMGLDVKKFASVEGFVDYMMPQLYFGFEYPNPKYSFTSYLDDWLAINTNKNIALYVGLAFYKAGGLQGDQTPANKAEWESKRDIIKRQVEHLRATHKTHSQLNGFVFFEYSALLNDPREAYLTERANVAPLLK